MTTGLVPVLVSCTISLAIGIVIVYITVIYTAVHHVVREYLLFMHGWGRIEVAATSTLSMESHDICM